MQYYEKIFFDLDGTLSDSYPGIENGIRFALAAEGVKDITSQEIKRLIGIPLFQSLKQYYFSDESQCQAAIHTFRSYYSEKGVLESSLYPGIMDMLHLLSKQAELFVVTAKPTMDAIKLLAHHGAANFFKSIKGCDMKQGSFSKANLILQETKLEKAIVIGDKQQDIVAGKAAGIQTGGVLYGYGHPNEFREAQPDIIIHSVDDLHHYLIG